MISMLRDWKTLLILALSTMLVLRMIPWESAAGPAGLPLGPSGGGSSADFADKSRGRVQPTSSPAVVDPQRLKGQLNPFLVLRAGVVRRGAPVVVGGGGFAPNQELVVTMQREGDTTPLELGAVRADKNGVLSDVSLPLPEGVAAGTYRIVATPSLGGPAVEASLSVDSGQTWGRLTSETAKPKGAVGFEGGGFLPGENVSLQLDSLGNAPLATVQASERGDVSGVLRIPLANEGSHLVLFYGDQSRMPVTTELSVLGFYPWVELDNYSPGPEQAVGFAGMDFAPGEKVYVFLNSLEAGPVMAVQVGADGTFKAPGALSLAPGVQGKQKLIFVGSQSQADVQAEFTVQPYPGALELTLYAGPPGSEVAFIGNGFAKGEEVYAYIGPPERGQKVSAFTADEKGTFHGAGGFRVPRDAKAGELTLSVAGQVSGVQASVVFSVLPISPWAEAKRDQAGRLVVIGHGFAPGEEVEVTLGKDGAKPVAVATVDRSGNAQFEPQEVPREGEGPILIQLKGRESGGQAKMEHYASPAPEGGGQPGNQEQSGLEFELEGGSPGATPTTRPAGQ